MSSRPVKLEELIRSAGDARPLTEANPTARRAQTRGGYRAKVTASSGLRLREEPVHGSTVTVLASGSQVYVLEAVENGAWLRVRQRSHVGYASASYLERVPTPSDPRPSSIRVYSGSQYIGKPLRVDEEFATHLNRLNAEARSRRVKIYVTSSLRRPSDELRGTIVPPSKRSNHLVGHAIDMNLQSDSGFFNSGKLAKSNIPKLPEEVRGLLQWVRDDSALRWGGDFRREDPVHIDDALNLRDPDLWQKKLEQV